MEKDDMVKSRYSNTLVQRRIDKEDRRAARAYTMVSGRNIVSATLTGGYHANQTKQEQTNGC